MQTNNSEVARLVRQIEAAHEAAQRGQGKCYAALSWMKQHLRRYIDEV